MIAYLRGTLVEKHPTRVVVDVGGVGYEVFIPLSSYDRLPARDAAVRILTVDHVREDVHQLFGFMTEPERAMFLLLISASGVGPKLAMGTLSGLSVRELRMAIIGNDVKRLSSISGIGKKTAERLILELRDKIGAADALDAAAGADEPAEADLKIRDAVLALIALGYKQDSARKMVDDALRARGTTGDATVEEIIKKALGGAVRTP